MNDATNLVLLFNTCANPAQAARVHVATCRMVNTAGKRVVATAGTLVQLRSSIDDLTNRLYPVRFCSCTK